jgi:hypothetical protein
MKSVLHFLAVIITTQVILIKYETLQASRRKS